MGTVVPTTAFPTAEHIATLRAVPRSTPGPASITLIDSIWSKSAHWGPTSSKIGRTHLPGLRLPLTGRPECPGGRLSSRTRVTGWSTRSMPSQSLAAGGTAGGRGGGGWVGLYFVFFFFFFVFCFFLFCFLFFFFLFGLCSVGLVCCVCVWGVVVYGGGSRFGVVGWGGFPAPALPAPDLVRPLFAASSPTSPGLAARDSPHQVRQASGPRGPRIVSVSAACRRRRRVALMKIRHPCAGWPRPTPAGLHELRLPAQTNAPGSSIMPGKAQTQNKTQQEAMGSWLPCRLLGEDPDRLLRGAQGNFESTRCGRSSSNNVRTSARILATRARTCAAYAIEGTVLDQTRLPDTSGPLADASSPPRSARTSA